MKNQILKPFAGLAIVWKSNSFNKAKIKLTGTYIIILTLILIWFSSLLFLYVWKKLANLPRISEQQAQKIVQEAFPDQEILTIEFEGWEYSFTLANGWEPRVDAFNQSLIDGDASAFQYAFLHDFEEVLFVVVFIVLIVVWFLSYFLAGKTLEPIKVSMEKQKQFVADAAHELRNPLTTIQLTSESMKRLEKFSTSVTREAFTDVFLESQRLISLTENLLILDRYQKDKVQEKLDLKVIVEYVVKILEPLAKKKHVDIKVQLENFLIRGQKKDFEHVVYNLLHNAIKFSKKSWKIHVTLNRAWEFVIEDFGIGIPENTLPYIFDRFYKADSGRKFSEDSWAGLGLSIVKELLHRYEGDIFVESMEGEWTKMIVCFSL